MPRLQVYLPDDLYAEVKARRLPASELLQRAVRAEIRRLELTGEADRYIEQLTDQVGEPGARERTRAEAIARRARGRRANRTARKPSAAPPSTRSWSRSASPMRPS